jgi:DNA-3-methyladenine glycosylase II
VSESRPGARELHAPDSRPSAASNSRRRHQEDRRAARRRASGGDHLSALTLGWLVNSPFEGAATIFGRFAAQFPDGHISSAEAIAAVDDAALRGVGLSGQKVGYVRDLCARITDGRLNLDELESLGDDGVIERLTSVKGFGRWTAEMFLMFRLHRPDVLPAGDLGIVNAIQRLYRLRKRPDAKRVLDR